MGTHTGHFSEVRSFSLRVQHTIVGTISLVEHICLNQGIGFTHMGPIPDMVKAPNPTAKIHKTNPAC